MLTGIYAPLPHVTVNSPELRIAADGNDDNFTHGNSDAAYRLSKDIVKIADDSGIDLCLVAERHLGSDLEAWVHAGALSECTNNIRIMPAFHPGLWHPVMLAKMASTLDRISGGRLALNLVTGWWDEEHTMFGGELKEGQDEKYTRAEEFAEIIRGLWSHDEYSFSGKHYEIDKAQLPLKPCGNKLPEIFTASKSPRSLEMAAKIGDYWFVAYEREAVTFEDVLKSVKKNMDDMRARAKKYNREIKFGMSTFVLVDDTDEMAQQRAKDILDEGVSDQFSSIQTSRMTAGLIGSPETVARRLKAYEDIGIDLVLMKFYATRGDIERIAKDALSIYKRL